MRPIGIAEIAHLSFSFNVAHSVLALALCGSSCTLRSSSTTLFAKHTPSSPCRLFVACGFFVTTARLAQSAERKARNLVVVGSSPTVGVFPNIDAATCLLRSCSKCVRLLISMSGVRASLGVFQINAGLSDRSQRSWRD